MKKTIVLSALFALSLPFAQVSAAETAPTYRYAGEDRFKTSVALADEWVESDVAVLATGRNYPDALSATPLAAKHGAPLLLTDKNSVPSSVITKLKELGVTKVYLIGGTGVISTAVDTQLKNAGVKTVTRIAGTDRYDTSVKVAKEVGLETGTLVVASGENYPDALSIAPFAGIIQSPILLTRSTDLPGVVKNYVKAADADFAIIAGGSAVVSEKATETLPETIRLGGSNRYATNTQIVDFAVESGIYDMDSPFIATGTNFPDALSASALAADWFNGVILTDPNEPKATTKQTIQKYADLAVEYEIVGGVKALPDSTIAKLFQK
ncbi:cell wall-binding repeat-containing protein [Bacillus sp. V2I10]|uniref:cell wall-binding repeat-containing protein n=1 Tax=Bacillus sp. V2I10 TaxID=3042276 RepID=UPI00278AA476|nr:cell wall-binding repeat-containing protein [Bacillus sp. V2I10]MDQ0859701.1 N-acetylmuramoyl-L-alanine amidase [Bacillus sp. V2I10]